MKETIDNGKMVCIVSHYSFTTGLPIYAPTGVGSIKRYTQEQTIGMLREVKVVLAQGGTAAQVCRT